MICAKILITFAFSAFLILFFQLINVQLDYRIFALSPSFERQEITDGDNDWIFWPSDTEENKINLQDNTSQSIPVAKIETDCKLKVESSPQIKSISYMSNGNILNSTMWISSNLIESEVHKNILNKDDLEKDSIQPLWKKKKFTAAIDINSVFNQGTDYRIELVNESRNSTQKWVEIIYEISANGQTKEVSKRVFDKFPYLNKNFVEFSIDLNKIGNPEDYKILFYVTDLFVKNGKLCRMVDSASWMLSPPPNFNLLISNNPIDLNPGDERDTFVTIEGTTAIQAEAELYINRTDPSVSLSFPVSNKTIISPLTNGSTMLYLNVSNSYFNESRSLNFPIIANISFASAITNKGSDTFHNNKTTFLSENVDLTVNIKKSLTYFEKLEQYFSIITRILRPIGESWQTLALFVVGITSFIYFIKRRKEKKYQVKLNDYQNELEDLHKDGKLDKSDIDNLDRLREKVVSAYTRGDLTKDQYDILIKNISIRYNEIFQNEITLLKNRYNNDEKIKLTEIQSDLDDAYLKEKINKEHYNLLKEKISKIEGTMTNK